MATPAGPAELVAIAMKALARERYPSVVEFQLDLRRYLEGREVSARRDPPAVRAVKWVRRNPIPSVAAAVAVAALVAGTMATRQRSESTRRTRVAQLLRERTLESCWGALSLDPANAEAQRLVEQIAAERREAARARARAGAEAQARELEAQVEALLVGVPADVTADRDTRRGAIAALVSAEDRLRRAQELTGTPPARRAEVSRRLGDWALSGKDYALARMALGQDPRVDEAELAEEKRQAQRIGEALADLASGLKGDSALADWQFEVVGFREEQTVRLLAEAVRPFADRARQDGKAATWSNDERVLVKFCFEVLGRIERQSAVEPLGEMMDLLWEHDLVVSCGIGLCNTRSEKVYPVLIAARNRLGVNSEQWRQIKRFFRRVPEPQGLAEPRTPGAFNNRGIARKAGGDLSGAIEDYTRAIELDPKYASAFINRGIARKAVGDLAGAIADWERFLELAPSHTRAAEFRRWIEETRAKLRRGEDCQRWRSCASSRPRRFSPRG